MASRRWSELSGPQQGAVVVLAAVELALTTAALVDLVRRPRDQVRGPKAVWGAACFVQPLGPVAYLTVGRRRPAPAGAAS